MLDIDTRVFIKSGYRITKIKNLTVARLRIPGGELPAELLSKIKEVAEKYGRGVLHLTSRQGIEIPYIEMAKVDIVRAELAQAVKTLEGLAGVSVEHPEKGYKAIGCRNISACIGSKVCRYGLIDSTELAKRIEARFFENDYHLKIAITACPHDCAKVWVQDIGIVARTLPVHKRERCIACEACVKRCRTFCHSSLDMKNRLPVRDEKTCSYCGECALACPTTAWQRQKTMYRILVGGRTGKKGARLAYPFIDFLDNEEVIFKLIENTFNFIDRFIDRSLRKEHLGYIIDREGFPVYKEAVLKDIALNKEAVVYDYNVKSWLEGAMFGES